VAQRKLCVALMGQLLVEHGDETQRGAVAAGDGDAVRASLSSRRLSRWGPSDVAGIQTPAPAPSRTGGC